MKFTEYVIHRISANTVRSILLFGDGGVGKTTALLELYRLLLAQTYEIEGKKVVPVYIPLNEFSSSGIRGDYIRSYIWKTYFDGQVTQNSVSHLDNYLLNEADGRYHFVLRRGLSELI